MKQERSDLLFLLVCLVLAAALSLGMLLFGPAEAKANELLASRPVLHGDQGWNAHYLTELSDYVSDRFFLRQELVTAHNRLLAALGGGEAADVIAGRDGWLYYAATLDDYTGAGALSEAELSAAAQNLALMREYCESRGAAFLFVPAPNKNSLYAEAMPSYGVQAAEHAAQRLLRLASDAGVPCADLFSAFRGQDETLYFAHDSHWNAKGAALAADTINAALGRQSAYFSADFSARSPHSGDLYEMRYPAGRDPETDCVYGGALDYTRAGSDTRPDSITINTSSDGDGRLLMFRDSFGNALYPYLADSFAAARFSRATAYNLALIDKLGADAVVVELVERNLRYLLRFAPVMPAPARDLNVPETVSGTVALSCPEATPALDGHILWRGTLPDAAPPADAVSLCCGEKAFAAFLGGDGSFSCYLPAELTPDRVAAACGASLSAYQTVNPQ